MEIDGPSSKQEHDCGEAIGDMDLGPARQSARHRDQVQCAEIPEGSKVEERHPSSVLDARKDS